MYLHHGLGLALPLNPTYPELVRLHEALTGWGRRCNNQGYDGTHCDGFGKGHNMLWKLLMAKS